MKTVLVTTCWLGTQDYIDRLHKWIQYYIGMNLTDNILILDNASSFTSLSEFTQYDVMFQRFTEHHGRPEFYDYKYLWRAVDFYNELFKEYDKIIYMDNDFYILSNKMVDDINNLSNTWTSPWCHKYKFPETGLQIITKDYVPYNEGFPFMKNNGSCMENVLPVQVNRFWNGNRHAEDNIFDQSPSWDYTAQCPVHMKVSYK